MLRSRLKKIPPAEDSGFVGTLADYSNTLRNNIAPQRIYHEGSIMHSHNLWPADCHLRNRTREVPETKSRRKKLPPADPHHRAPLNLTMIQGIFFTRFL